jgi:hypothetical protein
MPYRHWGNQVTEAAVLDVAFSRDGAVIAAAEATALSPCGPL